MYAENVVYNFPCVHVLILHNSFEKVLNTGCNILFLKSPVTLLVFIHRINENALCSIFLSIEIYMTKSSMPNVPFMQFTFVAYVQFKHIFL